MNEQYEFAARVAERWSNGQIQIVPDDLAAFREFRTRANLHGNDDWIESDQGPYVTVSAKSLVARSEGAERVVYTVEARGEGANRRMYGVDLRPI